MQTKTKSWKMILAGKERESQKALTVRNPFNDEPVGETWLASSTDLEHAVQAACTGFQKTKTLQPYERAAILLRIRDKIQVEKEAFAKLICLEAGKPISDARREVERSLITFEVASEEAKRLHGELFDLAIYETGKNRQGLFKPFPIGPILAITPFNFPLNLVAHKLAPAIAVGTSFVVKPASQTPLTSLKLAAVILEAGYPPEAVNVLPCEGALAEALVKDDRIQLLSFTGSPIVGWKLKSLAGKKKVVLELGGNAGVIIDENADVSHAAKRCVSGALSYAGQSCISVQRIFVHKSIQERFIASLLENVKGIKSGDPRDESVTLGPMIDEGAAKRSEQWIQEAVTQGAKLLAGGKRHGKLLEPTVLTNVSRNMKIDCEEVFAPMLNVTPFQDFDEALHAINDSHYGLQTGIFTNDFRRIMKAYSELEVGGVIVNDIPTWRMESMPYGGVKDSGFGREGVRFAMQEMTEGKLLVFSTG